MSCAMLALLDQGIKVDKYVAYEVDKYAIKTSMHNFPNIEQRGDVFNADFTEFKGFDYLMGGSPCFVAGTMIKTDTGIKPIEEIKVGDRVLTHKGRYMSVKETMNRKVDSTVLVKAENCGVVECTSEHPFYTKDIVRKFNQEKRCYDRVLDEKFYWTDPAHFTKITNNSGTIKQQTYLTSVTDDIKNQVVYDGIDIKVNQTTTRHISNLSLNNADLWYIIGRWIGDGWFKYKYRYKEENKLSGVVICCGKHKIEKFESKLQAAGLNYTKNEERTVYKISISNVEFASYLMQFGKGAKNKHLTQDIYSLPDELALSFLSGYFDADGYINNHIVHFSTISKELAYGIKYMVNKYYKTSCTISIEKENHSNVIENRKVNTNPIYNGVFHQNRQKQSHYFVEDNYILAPHKNITTINKPNIVYNLSVEEDESYTANGLVVHNCTYWSIAQKNNRETEASGLGWELFSQYVRALKEAQPKYFIYENNKSMSDAIKESITNTFGFEPIMIDSALLSAQTRKRLYWVGKRNPDGTYSQVKIEQPKDKGIVLKDILEDSNIVDKDKAYCLKHQAGNARDYIKKHHTQVKFEPVRVGALPRPNGELSKSQAFRIYSTEGKSVNINSGGGGAGGKTGLYAVPVKVGEVNGGGQGNRLYSVEGKSVSQTATSGGLGSNTGLYAIPTPTYATPIEWDEYGKPIKAISGVDGKEYVVYEVKNGLITFKDKEYKIALEDGFYIIRKLSVLECMRLQTVPEWYDFSVVSDTQAYKMLGNGWTVDVIKYLLSHTLE